MKKREVKIVEQIDKDVFKDEHNRKILVDYKRNKAYIVAKEDEKRMNVLQARIVIGLTIAILVGFNFNWIVGVVAGLLIVAILSYLYYKKFVPSLEEISPESIPEKKPLYVSMAEAGKVRIIVSSVCVVALPIVAIANFIITLKASNYVWDFNNILLLIVTVGLVVFSLYMAYNTVKALKYLSKKLTI